MSVTIAVDHDICAHCEQKIQTALGDVEGIKRASVDRDTDTVEVTGPTDVDAVLAAIDGAGFEATVQSGR